MNTEEKKAKSNVIFINNKKYVIIKHSIKGEFIWLI